MSKPRPSKRLFFWEGKLHKVLRINRPVNLVEAWRYADKKTVTLLYSDYKMNAEFAFSQREAAKIIKMHPDTLDKYIQWGYIPKPQQSYSLDGKMRPYNRWWSQQDLLNLHDYVTSVHRGRPRMDGKITPMQHIATRAEIVATFNKSQVVYIEGDNGTMIPLFKPPKI